MTTLEEETKKYRKSLFEITHFKAPEYRLRTWKFEETKKIPLESQGTLPDPRIKKRKMPATSQIQRRMLRRLASPVKILNCLDAAPTKILKKIRNLEKISSPP